MKRTLAIGDIHGGLKALVQVLERAKITTEDTLIFVGDYVDGWSESAQVLSFLIQLSKKQTCIFIKGNHDVWTQNWLKTKRKNEIWLIHGGKETVESYKRIGRREKRRHKIFLEKMPYYFIDSENRLFIHAGFTSMHGPEKEFYQTNFSWDRTLWETALSIDKKIDKNNIIFPKRLKLFSEIFIGHTPTTKFNQDTPMQGCNVWNVDTGAAFKGKLTCMDIETKQFWQSDELPSLYPNEKGRN